MKLQLFFITAIMMIFVAGCGSQGGTLNLQVDAASTGSNNNGSGGTGGTSSGSSKALLSSWTESNGYFRVDLSSVKMSVSSPISIVAITGETCSCNILIQGSDSSGSMAFSSCSGTVQGQSCASQFNSSDNYTNSAETLQICSTVNSTCLTLK